MGRTSNGRFAPVLRWLGLTMVVVLLLQIAAVLTGSDDAEIALVLGQAPISCALKLALGMQKLSADADAFNLLALALLANRAPRLALPASQSAVSCWATSLTRASNDEKGTIASASHLLPSKGMYSMKRTSIGRSIESLAKSRSSCSRRCTS